MIGALENAPSKGLTRQKIKNMLEGKNSKLRQEIANKEENTYRRGITYIDKFMKSIATQLKIFKK